jgi:hypothetical protein
MGSGDSREREQGERRRCYEEIGGATAPYDDICKLINGGFSLRSPRGNSVGRKALAP